MSVHASFVSHLAYRQFSAEVKRDKDSTLSIEATAFLETVLATANSRLRVEPIGRALWRAQIAHKWKAEHNNDVEFEVPCPCDRERMTPNPEKVNDGRANTRGTAYLYAATDRETAIAEVRPWVGAYVTIAQFTNIRELRLIDFAGDQRECVRVFFRPPDMSKWEQLVWEDINTAFSRPVAPHESTEYIPTQLIAAHLKENGFDGIVYRSSLGPGGNCCLFALDAVAVESRHLHLVKSVKYFAPEEGTPE